MSAHSGRPNGTPAARAVQFLAKTWRTATSSLVGRVSLITALTRGRRPSPFQCHAATRTRGSGFRLGRITAAGKLRGDDHRFLPAVPSSARRGRLHERTRRPLSPDVPRAIPEHSAIAEACETIADAPAVLDRPSDSSEHDRGRVRDWLAYSSCAASLGRRS
jgi:hypothetical protein